ncbi:lipoprotein HlpB [Ursidibacter sp. B-7004-1]
MNKFTKISAAALFALFLTACDKPAEKKAEAPAAQPETTQVAKVEEKKAEEAKPVAEAPKAEQAPVAETPKAEQTSEADAQGVEDFKKLVAWNAEQEKEMATLQADLQQKIATQDKAQIESAFTQFTAKVSDVVKSLDAVEIKNAEVQKLKDKLKESLSLSSELLSASIKAMTGQPSEELQNEMKGKTEKLIQVGTELQTIQAELQQKFAK